MRFAVHVEVSSLEGIADPEGQTIERALPALGFTGVESVHVGKVVRFVLEAPDEPAARVTAESICDRLLANPVIERAEATVAPLGPPTSTAPPTSTVESGSVAGARAAPGPRAHA